MTSDATPYSIDHARPGDERALAAMIHELAEYERLANQCKATAESLARQLFQPGAPAEVLIAKVGTTPAGFAVFFRTFSTFLAAPGLYLEDLYVRPDFRRRGIGGAMLRMLAAIARDRGYGRMEWATQEWNELAMGQYRKIGGRALQDWRTWRLERDGIYSLAMSADETRS